MKKGFLSLFLLLMIGLLAACSSSNAGEEEAMTDESEEMMDESEEMTDESEEGMEEEMSEEDMSESDMSDESDMMSGEWKGTFSGENGEEVSGDVTVTEEAVTFSNFSSSDGPALEVYIVEEGAGIEDGVKLGDLQSTEGDQTYELGDVVPADGQEIVIYCEEADKVFGVAEISAGM